MFPPMKEHSELDEVTADRLLGGGLAPDDAPQGYQDVARTLQAAALVAVEAPSEDAETAVAAFHAARPVRRIQRMKKWKMAAATLAGGLTLSTGLAAADVLPGAAQDVASDALAKVGISVPGNHDDNANTRGKSADHKKAAEDDTPDVSTATSHPENHGSVVSNVARDDSTTGAEHGATVCATASEGKCQTGGPDTTNAARANANTNAGQGSANAGQGSANHTETSSPMGSDGSANAGQSSGSGSGGSTNTQTHSGGSGGSSSGSSVSSGTGG